MNDTSTVRPIPWNKGRLIGQKPPLKLQAIRILRTRLPLANKTRELALFDLALDSKLRAATWWPYMLTASPHLSTRQYTRIVKSWAALIGADPHEYGTHSLRRGAPRRP